jgi:hypothetical protein
MFARSPRTVIRRLKLAFAGLLACAFAIPCAAQCGFAIVPAADERWVRNEGWSIPGLSDARGFAHIHRTVNGVPKDWVWPEGITVSWVVHDDNYNVRFPDAVFDDNGSRKRMLARSFKLYQMLRWEMNGTPYAYSYELGPHDVACLATVDVIDDRGDGKFRLMTSPGHLLMVLPGQNPAPPPLPDWLKKPKS